MPAAMANKFMTDFDFCKEVAKKLLDGQSGNLEKEKLHSPPG